MLEMPKNSLEWAKFLTTRTVAAGWTMILRSAVENHTEWDEDSIPVRATTYVAGEYVAAYAQSATDEGVEKVWYWLAAKRVARQNRKNKAKK